MTLRHCCKHKNLSVAWEDDQTYAQGATQECPVCSWEQKGGKVTAEGKLIEEMAADG